MNSLIINFSLTDEEQHWIRMMIYSTYIQLYVVC